MSCLNIKTDNQVWNELYGYGESSSMGLVPEEWKDGDKSKDKCVVLVSRDEDGAELKGKGLYPHLWSWFGSGLKEQDPSD